MIFYYVMVYVLAFQQQLWKLHYEQEKKRALQFWTHSTINARQMF